MSARKSFTKYVAERRRLYIDYDCWLPADEKLTTFTTLITPLTAEAPLTVDVAFTDVAQRKLAVFAGEGKANTQYTVQMIVNTDAGQVKRDDIALTVKP
jgi:hypothetical protein